VDEQELDLREQVASHFETESEQLTDAWLQLMQRRLRIRLVRILPTEELRDHMPLVIASIGTSLRLTGDNPADEFIAHLRVLSELRRNQSYPVVEVLNELQILSGLLFDAVVEIVDRGAWDGRVVANLCAELHSRLDSLGIIAVDAYQEAYLREKQQVAERLADLAATLEHELRTPLQAAVSGLDMLRDDAVAGDPDRREHYTDYVHERLHKVTHLLTDIRELGTAERVLTREDRRPIREVIRTVLDEIEDIAKDTDVRTIVVDPIEDLLVDPARIEVALMNLVSNAVKYSDPDKPERWVKISLSSVPEIKPPRWRLTVEDNGLGIPHGFEQTVFHRRIRIHPERAEGTGLGLAIAKDMIEQRGGSITVSSEQGVGSTFTLEMTHHLAEPQGLKVKPTRGDDEVVDEPDEVVSDDDQESDGCPDEQSDDEGPDEQRDAASSDEPPK
jgi:signal transduction histidine kinase